MSSPADGERDLATLLRQLSPELLPGEFLYCSVSEEQLSGLSTLAPRALVREREGVTLVLERSVAEAHGLGGAEIMRCITLNVHSSLDAVGLTAAVSTALAQNGISANVLAGYYHDHVYVPTSVAERALGLLAALSR